MDAFEFESIQKDMLGAIKESLTANLYQIITNQWWKKKQTRWSSDVKPTFCQLAVLESNIHSASKVQM